MELAEPVELINSQLVHLFGIDSITGREIWRVVWSEDQFEKRLMYFTDDGFQLITPEVRMVPRYRQWIKERWVLERLTIVPEINLSDLPSEKLSYEPMWVFETQRGDYLPPKLDAAKIVVDSIYAALGKKSMAKYKDPDSKQEDAIANQKQRIDEIAADLFGNESPVGDALAHKDGVGFTTSHIKES